ncbi:unnamed protein product, partial [Ectocarpus sp. 6 AP-2014]
SCDASLLVLGVPVGMLASANHATRAFSFLGGQLECLALANRRLGILARHLGLTVPEWFSPRCGNFQPSFRYGRLEATTVVHFLASGGRMERGENSLLEAGGKKGEGGTWHFEGKQATGNRCDDRGVWRRRGHHFSGQQRQTGATLEVSREGACIVLAVAPGLRYERVGRGALRIPSWKS